MFHFGCWYLLHFTVFGPAVYNGTSRKKNRRKETPNMFIKILNTIQRSGGWSQKQYEALSLA